MLITFLVRSRQFSLTNAYLRFYTDIQGAFDLAYIIDNHPKTIEFKCLFDEVIMNEIPGSSYKPNRLVRDFNYQVE
jgi:hypothetical protein